MTSIQLMLFYGATGALLALVVVRRERGPMPQRLVYACITLVAWPLATPLLLLPPATTRETEGLGGVAHSTAAAKAARALAALDEGMAATEGSPLAALLTSETVGRIRVQLAHAVARQRELGAVLAQPGFDVTAARQRIVRLEADNAAPRALATARLHLANVERLTSLHAQDLCTLDEIADLAVALRTQLVLARYAGSSAEGAGGIVAEMWDRVEGLGAALTEVEA